jgi:uncharacterized cupredoxin-like copper-binding protein
MLARCVPCIAVLALLAGCTAARDSGADAAANAAVRHSAEQSSPALANVVTVVATDYAFQAPAAVPAGLTTFLLANRGHQLHMMGLTKLENGKSIPELLAILTKNQPQPAWAVDLGGPNAVSPGDTSNSTAVLTAGHYALICWMPGADGAMHVMKGMLAPIEVTASPTAAAPEPAADVVVRLADYHIDVSRPITPGRHTFRVENDGPQEHDVTVLETAPGKSPAEVLAWFNEPANGTPAARALGGIVGIPRGTHGFFTGDFHRGEYLLLCFVPDEHDGKPHFQHGMVRQITVS